MISGNALTIDQEGIKTTIPFHRQLMDNSDYISGNYTTKFMEDFKIKEN